MHRFIVGLAVLIALSALPARAQSLGQVQARIKQEDAQREALRKEIENLLEVSGSAQLAVQVATTISGQIVEQLRSNPSVPPRAIDVAKEVLDQEFKKAFAAPDGLMAAIVRVYANHFTSDEVRQLVDFYNTEIGKKLVARLPLLTQESMDVAQKWAAKETPRIMGVLKERLTKEGLIK